ncbi:hypothetical protein I79_000093 [Cricetulus griseus]|uniref:Uncharacterized protein n=1 Tax=Cricetulus griseus TaxID=10029 RepID=G3GRE8_CRIGR|nr:hypothetical protein I79_000093 [Cricetulus griseus]
MSPARTCSCCVLNLALPRVCWGTGVCVLRSVQGLQILCNYRRISPGWSLLSD